ncbi:penicillin-binding protein 2 [candidate division WWE3 bacterium]|nr:penicillin-binding protein 2 [candidate division WWE3 bacterium]
MSRAVFKLHLGNLRLKVLIFCQICVATLFILRLFYIQVINHQKYRVMAEEQYWVNQELPAKRGDILSSDGYPLATTQISYLMYAQPDNIKDKFQLANDLAFIITSFTKSNSEDSNDSTNESSIQDQTTRDIQNSSNFNAESQNENENETKYQRLTDFEELKSRFNEILNLPLKWVASEHYLTEEQKTLIQSKNFAGVGFELEPRRYYPENTLASHVLGFVAKNENGEEQGYFGIEGNLNGDLRGKPGRILEQKDATGSTILVGGYTKVDPIDGRNVVLSINRAIQFLVEKKLQEGVKRYKALSGSVIVMDPSTGDVLAMANFPTYNPAKFNDEDTLESTTEYKVERRNLALSETYEPGSVVKPVTISAGIDLGKITPETTFNDGGPVYYSGYKIDNWDGKHHGTQTIINLLQKSNNIGSAWVGHLLGSKNLYTYFKKYSLGDKTGIDLEGEETGIVQNYRDWKDIDLANHAFGQGISTTPLQVLNVFSAIANNGELLRPRIIKKMYESGKEIEIPVKSIRKVISPKSAETMNSMLIEAVAGGESKFFNLKNYDIAGKTGTAQIFIDGKYDPNKTNATFVGYMAKSKKFAMIVRLNQPSTSPFAAETAVPLWMNIADDLIKYFGIPQDRKL